MDETNDLSIEKLKLNDRIHSLELEFTKQSSEIRGQVNRVVSHLDSEIGTFERFTASNHRTIEKIQEVLDHYDLILRGDNDTPGIISRVGILESIEKDRKKNYWLMWGAIWALIANFL